MLEVYAEAFDGVAFGVAIEEGTVFAASFGLSIADVLANLQKIVPSNLPYQVASESSVFAQQVLTVLKDVYKGKSTKQNVPLMLERFPAYTQRVLKTVCQIPVGYVVSYGAVADVAGGGARAVGNVMANNAFAPIVPCHRVVTSSLGLGGYGGGLQVKYEFLKREKRGHEASRDVLVNGRVLRVFPVEFVLNKLEKSVARKSQ
jgi:O-6-methylguanine DNA methyltransferase